MRVASVLLTKAKSKIVMVRLRSTGSNHLMNSFRERTGEKKEMIFFDPHIGMECVYKEEKKIRGMKRPLQITKAYNEDTYGIITQELLDAVAKEDSENLSNTPKNKEKGKK